MRNKPYIDIDGFK